MSAVMTGIKPATPKEFEVPDFVLETIERHLEAHEGLPTKELVERICMDPEVVCRRMSVIRYFLVESPLEARDLGSLVMRVAGNQSDARSVFNQTSALRKYRLLHADEHPVRWEARV